MSILGYTLVGTFFQPNGEMIDNQPVKMILQELALYRHILTDGKAVTPTMYSFVDATPVLCDLFGLKCIF
jgi:hypothetical protein